MELSKFQTFDTILFYYSSAQLDISGYKVQLLHLCASIYSVRVCVKPQQTFQARPRQPVKVVIRMCCGTQIRRASSHPERRTHISQPVLRCCGLQLHPACKV